MLSDRRYQIFLSSTYEDLRQERQAATSSILSLGHIAAGMELFPATDLSQLDLIKKVIDESDYYVVIIGAKYGSVEKQSNLSYTEIEYNYAIEKNIPILGFVVKDVGQVPQNKSEQNFDSIEKLKSFRKKVLSKTCQMFESPDDLKSKVMSSLVTEMRINPQTGWVKADQARSESDIERERILSEELISQKETIEDLKRKLRDTSLPIKELNHNQIAQGEDEYSITVTFQNNHKRLISHKVLLSWDEIYAVIGAQMFGYIMRRPENRYGEISHYSFQPALIERIRLELIEECGQRKLSLMQHEVDAILIQFKQLGYIEMNENKQENGEVFRGYSLTENGEVHLTKLKVQTRK